MVEQPVQVPLNQNAVSIDEIYRQYGEATIQLKLAQGRVMQLEQQIQQFLNPRPPVAQ